MTNMANSLVGKPYVYGGGHGGWGPQAGYDCSGFVSAVLHAGGYLSQPVDTTALPQQAGMESGPGPVRDGLRPRASRPERPRDHRDQRPVLRVGRLARRVGRWRWRREDRHAVGGVPGQRSRTCFTPPGCSAARHQRSRARRRTARSARPRAHLRMPVDVRDVAPQPLPARRLKRDQRRRPHRDPHAVPCQHAQRALGDVDLAERGRVDVVGHHEVARAPRAQVDTSAPSSAATPEITAFRSSHLGAGARAAPGRAARSPSAPGRSARPGSASAVRNMLEDRGASQSGERTSLTPMYRQPSSIPGARQSSAGARTPGSAARPRRGPGLRRPRST